MLFSVIIPTYHRNDLLTKCLDRLASDSQTLSVEHYEVIVTDNGSVTTAEQMIRERYPWVKWVAGPRKGVAGNRNNGAGYAQGEWLAFIDDDCIPDPEWLESYAQAISLQPTCLVFEGRVYVDRPKLSLAETAPIFETGGYLPSGNFVCQKKLFKLLGGFDERFQFAGMEDVELRLRLIKANYKFSFIRDAAVFHPWRIKGGWKQLKQHEESTFVYLSIHPDEIKRINSKYYLKAAILGLIKTTIPGIWKYKGRGVAKALLEHISHLWTAVLLVNFRMRKHLNSSQHLRSL